METVGTLRFGSKVYRPRLGEIEETSIGETQSTEYGIYITIGYSGRIGPLSFISTKFSHGSIMYYVRKEDAIEVQKQMRARKLKELQEDADKALNELNTFTNLYFSAI